MSSRARCAGRAPFAVVALVTAAAFALGAPGCKTQKHVCAEQRNFGACKQACEAGDRAACIAGQRMAHKVCDGDASDPYFDGSLSTRTVQGACDEAVRLQKKANALPE